MAQQNIDTGTGPGANDGDFVHDFSIASQSNFDELYTLVSQLGGGQVYETPFNLVGISTSLSELEQVAAAINAKPTFTVPPGRLNVVSYRSSGLVTSPASFEMSSYAIKLGGGDYGTGGTQITSANLIPLGKVRTESATVNDLGDIGATPIQTYVNAASPAYTVAGVTQFNATISGQDKVYIFDGDDGLYGSGEGQTNADNFVEIGADSGINDPGEALSPILANSDFTVSSKMSNRLVHVTHNNSIVTIDTNANVPIEAGTLLRLNFSGSGVHTINYPITDGISSLQVQSGALVFVQKRNTDEWIVRNIAGASENKTFRQTVTVSSAQALTADTTPISLGLSLPGAGKFIAPIRYSSIYNYGTVAYTGGDLRLRYTGSGDNLGRVAETGDGSDRREVGLIPLGTKAEENIGLEIYADAPIADGDGDFSITIIGEILEW